jgi:hemerythrin
MAIIWKNDFSVGIPEMDHQHQRLVTMINQLDEAMGKGKGKEVIGKILAELGQRQLFLSATTIIICQ